MANDLLRKIAHPRLLNNMQWHMLFIVIYCASTIRGRISGVNSLSPKALSTDLFREGSSPEEVHLVTCTSSKADARLQMLLNKAESMGYTAHWLNCSGAFSDQSKALWGVRLQQYQNFIEGLHGDPLVAFVDGLDVLAEGPAAEAASRFAEFKTPLVFSCVSYAYPLNCAAYAHHHATGPCSYPCGGASMGRASGFRKLFNQGGNFTAETDDQCWLYSALNDHMKGGDEYVLDSHSRLFLSYTTNIAWHFPYSLDGGRHVVDVSGLESRPTFVHLDTAHPGIEEMGSLQPCSDGVHCKQATEGWWPEPASKKLMDQIVCGLAFLCVVVAALCSVTRARMEKKASK